MVTKGDAGVVKPDLTAGILVVTEDAVKPVWLLPIALAGCPGRTPELPVPDDLRDAPVAQSAPELPAIQNR